MNTRQLLLIDNPLLTHEIGGPFVVVVFHQNEQVKYILDTTDTKGDGVSG
jgi:hypothetical protein